LAQFIPQILKLRGCDLFNQILLNLFDALNVFRNSFVANI